MVLWTSRTVGSRKQIRRFSKLDWKERKKFKNKYLCQATNTKFFPCEANARPICKKFLRNGAENSLPGARSDDSKRREARRVNPRVLFLHPQWVFASCDRGEACPARDFELWGGSFKKKLSLAGLAKPSRLRYSWLRFGLASAGYRGGVNDRPVYTGG